MIDTVDTKSGVVYIMNIPRVTQEARNSGGDPLHLKYMIYNGAKADVALVWAEVPLIK